MLKNRLLKPSSTLFGFTILALTCISFLSQAETSLNDAIANVINHPDRNLSDKEKDKSRKPAQILPFTQIKPGDKVLELGSGGGHTTELLARLVDNSGSVYAQGLSPSRVRGNRLPNVISLRKHLLYQLEDVLKEHNVEENTLDSVVLFFTLHDFYLNSRIDQQAVLQTLFKLLKPDGSLILLDNAADADAGLSVNRKLHRIGENFVIQELNKAGFEVEAKSDALRNSKDDHTQRWQEFSGMHDRFAIRFRKK
jgi:predicted methyltransferase